MERPRQEPVSCESCRKKKLKCSREQPCSNCVTRGLSCIFSGRRVSPPVTSSLQQEDIPSLRAENAAIKARIDRLEGIIFSSDSHSYSGDSGRPAKARRLAKTDGVIPSPSTTVSSHTEPEIANEYKKDSRWLESIGTQENTRLPQLSAEFDIRIGTIDQIKRHATADLHKRCIFLPHKDKANELFNLYEDQIDPTQHVIHVPTVRRSIEQLYSRLLVGKRIEPNDTVLLLGILASIASYFRHTDSTLPTLYWLRTALDVLEHVRRSASATLETVQASMLIIFLIFHIEGFSPKVRAIMATALSAAKDLRLHMTDSDSNAIQDQSCSEVVDTEIRRRVWWHLASTDWTMALAGGPHEGMYNVNPKHMKCKRPRNVSDEELETEAPDFEHPLTEPTVMSYYLQRIRLSEISRNITDKICCTSIEEFSVDDVLEIDNDFDSMYSELPPFLRMDTQGQDQHVDIAHPHVVLQRYISNLAFHAKRCKFHFPFLSRASGDPELAFSRDNLLNSARAILQLKDELTAEHGSMWLQSSKLGGFLFFFFYAAVVLVMDLCINPTLGDEAARKEEIRSAFKALEEAKQQPIAARVFLDSLTAILRKHKIMLQGQHANEPRDGLSESHIVEADMAESADPNGGALSTDEEALMSLDFDEIWQSYIASDAGMIPQNWDALVNDLGACIG